MTIRRAPLPVDAVLGELVAKLRAHRNVVLVAPPGAGKTTRVPQVILDSGLMAPGEVVVVLEPRRLAARLASRRIASERGVRLGDEVGYQVRFDDRTSKATRIAFLTEGILTRRIQSDATLEGIGAVVLDEFHERSIHADLALAFLREIQQTVRPELAIVVMSATLDPLPVAKFLGDAPIVHAEGRSYPVEVEWLEEADDRPLVDRVVSGVRRALRTDEAKGNVLAFLPGAPEIRRVADALAPHVEGVDILPLYGELSPEAQDRAVDPSGRRKVVLATNIAESSLTIEGVTFVVDAGLAKVSRHDPALGIDRLELVRISRSSADQRTGRAGRTAPGRALRLWTEKEDRVLAPSEAPELMRVDLAPASLEIVRWSQRDPRVFGWFEPPPSAMVDRALGLLSLFGAIEHGGDDRWSLTPLGEQISQFPVHPRIAMMLLSAVRHGVVDDGATIAALLSERDIVRRARDAKNDLVASSDVLLRAERWEELARSGFSIGLADRLGLDANAARAVKDVRERLLDLARRAPKLPARSQGVKNTSKNVDVSGRRGEARRPRPPASREEALLRAILAGYPDRVGRRRAPGDDRIALAGGGGARMSRESVVKEGELLVAIDVDGGARGQRDAALVRVASQVERAWLAEDTHGLVEEKKVRWNAQREAAESVLVVRYQDLVLEERIAEPGDPDALAAALLEAALEQPERALPLSEGAEQLLLRLRFLRRARPNLELDWVDGDVRRALIPDLVEGRRSFADLQKVSVAGAIRNHLAHDVARALEADAPERLEVPSGRKVELRYEVDGPPVLSVRLQEVFGMHETPKVGGGRVPVKMELLAPNQRPVQVTQDLRSFWANTYAEVRNELRRRYPKHQWPEDPRDGDPTKKPGRR